MKLFIGLLCLLFVSCSTLPEAPKRLRSQQALQSPRVSNANGVRVLALIPCIENGYDPEYLVSGTPFAVVDYFGDVFSLNRPGLGESQLTNPWCVIALETVSLSSTNALSQATEILTAAFGQAPYAITLESEPFTNDPSLQSFDSNCTQLPALQQEAVGTTPVLVRNLRQTLGINPKLTGRGMTIAVIDGGTETGSSISSASRQFVETDYPYVNPNSSDSRDEFDCAQTSYVDGHGKLVTGIIRTVAPEAKVIMLKACNKEGICSISSIAKALLYLRNRYLGFPTVDVVNMSFGGLPKTGDPISQAIIMDMKTSQPGTLLVASVGNTREASNHFPAALSLQNNTLLPVAATKLIVGNWSLASFNTCTVLIEAGIEPFGAPGVNLVISDGYGTRNITGTSFAAPVVSAMAVLKRQGNPTGLKSGSSLLQNLRNTAQNIGNFKLVRY
jgi:subtilisin family serine protease